MGRKAQRESDRLLAAAGTKTIRKNGAKQAKAARHAQYARFIMAFAKRVNNAAIATWATTKKKK